MFCRMTAYVEKSIENIIFPCNNFFTQVKTQRIFSIWVNTKKNRDENIKTNQFLLVLATKHVLIVLFNDPVFQTANGLLY